MAPDYISDRGFQAKPIYLADLDRCAPADAWSSEAAPGRWRRLPYETADFKGAMMTAGPETRAPRLTYPLRAEGWHAISIGIHATGHGEGEDGELLVRLSGDETFSILTWGPSHLDGHTRRKQLEEVFWKVADLSGQQIVFSQLTVRVHPEEGPGALRCRPARVAYIKLVPLNQAESQELLSERAGGRQRRLFAHEDSHGPHYIYRLTTAEQIRRGIEPYRDTDFSRMYWESGGGDLLHYFTNIGRLPDAPGMQDFGRVGDRLMAESWRSFRAQGLDPFEVAIEHTHALGMEFHASYRLAAWTYPPPLDHDYRDGMFARHPELHCLDRDGQPLPRLSFAFRETQDYVLALLREMCSFPIDGVCLLFNRRPPYLAYETPLIDGFERAHGQDPRMLPDDDPEWLDFRAGVMTDFMRRVRRELDEVARQQGRAKAFDLSACVLGLPTENRYFGLDLDLWAREGLIDTLIPYSAATLAMPIETDTWTSAEEIEPFVRAVHGTQCVLAPNVMPRHMPPADLRRLADMVYDAGADHLFFWDCAGPHGRANYREMWDALRRLGHRAEIKAWRQAGESSLSATTLPLESLGGWDMGVIAPG